MNHSSARWATASTGKTAIAIVAMLSIMLSLFAFARPVAADHSGFDHQPLPIDTSTFETDSGECEGVALEPGQVLLHWIANQQNVTEAITLTLFLQGGDELTADSYKWNEPATTNNNVTHHFEFILDADVVVEDLDISTGEGNIRLSHVCRADAGEGQPGGEQPGRDDDAALNIFKLVENTTTRLPGAVFEIDGMDGTFVTDERGQICITGLPNDSEWLVREVQAPDGYEIIEAEQLVEVDNDGDCDSPDARFYNRPTEGEQPAETSQIEIMKHLCPDVSTTDEFVAIEAAGRDEADSTGLEENEDFAALAATVVNCPTIILSANVPMDEAPMAQTGEFEFTVLDANGEQVLSTDGLFVDDRLCETDISVDVDNNGSFDADVCLDTSYYRFQVEDGMVTITETDAPGDASFFGTIRFTPGSGDEMALVGSIPEVEQSGGVITLDTTADPDNSGEGTPDEYSDDVIMVHVYNFTPAEGEQPAETSQIEIMKHLCPDVSTTDEFVAIEAAGRDEADSTGLEENEDFAALAATVVNCPTIILSANVPMDEAPMAQTGEFEFTVLDANGEQVLSTDGLFVDDRLCETDISVDVDNNGSFDADVCLDTSYYRFQVEDGMVTITETDAPGDASFFGTIRFTPGSGDEMALVGSIPEVEQSGGVITLDTTADPDNSGEGTPDEYSDDVIMVHVYNFTPAEGEQPGTGGNRPPNEGTLGGSGGPRSGSLPNTALPDNASGTVPGAFLVLLALGGLGGLSYAVRAGARSRR